MSNFLLSSADAQFRRDFESCSCTPESFDHRAHVRLAYIYLADPGGEEALVLVPHVLKAFIAHHGISPAKYHETLTHAWLFAVRHFMERSRYVDGADTVFESADAFIDANPRLLDPKIMLTHYTADLLFSSAARAAFVEPDLEEIPRYHGGGRG